MRELFSSSLGSRAGKLALSLLFASSSVLPSGTAAFSFSPAPSPNLDIGGLGRVAFAGDFDSISLYQYQGQTEKPTTLNGALLARFPNGVFATLKDTDADIKTMCPFTRNGTLQGVVFGGNFTSVGGLSTPGGIALLNVKDGSVAPLPGLNGSVNAIFCDNDSNGQVYVGGAFQGGSSTNAIVWRDDWTHMPFSGFNGPVSSITKSNGKVIFGGTFNSLGDNSTAPTQNDTQVLPIGSATITAQTNSGRPGFTEPKNIVCKTNADAEGSGSTWLLADNTPGFWKADFGFGFEPTKVRLHNTKFEGRGTKTWRFTALPDGGIMNFSYVDPTTKQRSYCDARCPLPQDNTTAQDFTFVNVVGMNSFKIDISDWYGQGGGLNGIEIFQNDIYTYAINDFNEPKCGGVTTGASASPTGPWQQTPSHSSTANYLTATLQMTNFNPNAASVVFQPDIRQSGNYSVTFFTPGCVGDGTCGTRGRVTINATLSKSGTTKPTTTELWQTNDFDKYDEIHLGFVDATDGFRPSVTLTPSLDQGQTPAQRQGTLSVVAQRVRFKVLKASAGGLNGLFEYDPNQQVVDSDFAASVIDAAGASLNPQDQAIITSVASANDRLYVGGSFSSSAGLNNIFFVQKNSQNATPMKGNGLNSQVMTIFQNGSTVYVGGNFTDTNNNDTAGLKGVAAYSNDQWQPLGAGVNGVVMYVVPFTLNITRNTPEPVLGVTGLFDRVNGFGSNASFTANGFAVWVPSRKNWLQNIGVSTIAVQGRLMATTNYTKADTVFAGSINSQSTRASGAVSLDTGDPLSLNAFPMAIHPQQQQASLRKRALVGSQGQNTTGVVTAVFQVRGNSADRTVFAGHFAATSSDGQNITNVLVIDGKNNNKITGFGEQMDPNSTFTTLSIPDQTDTLFAGGSISGTINNVRVAGVVLYDLSSGSFPNTQPPALQGVNVTVNAIAPRKNSKDVFIGGNFQSAGALSCPSLCIWNTDRNQWTSPGSELSGVVTSLTWISDTKLLIAGNLTSGNNETKIISYDSTTSQFQEVGNSRSLPGPVTALSPSKKDGSQFWAAGKASDGTAFLQKFDGTKWVPINGIFDKGTEVRGLQVLMLRNGHSKSVIDDNQDLLVLGQINITNFGTASGALFNGTTLLPFLLSTTEQNKPGSLSQIFVSKPESFLNSSQKHLALGFIVLIALAIALALTFLLVVAGILLEYYRKRVKGYAPAPTAYPDRMIDTGRVPPEQLFGTLSGNRAPAI